MPSTPNRDNRIQMLADGGRKKAQLLASYLEEDIKRGIYKAGEKLPSYDDLGLDFCINRLTVRKAIKILEEQNIVHSISAKGTYAGPGEAKDEDQSGAASNMVAFYSEVVDFNTMGYHHLELISALSKALTPHQLQMSFIHDNNPKSLKLEDLKKYAGVIAIGPIHKSSSKTFERLTAFVHIDPQVESNSICISADYQQGGRLAAEHLLSLGHQNIALIHGDQPSCDLIHKGFIDACPSHTKLHSYHGNYTAPSAQACVEQMLEASPQCTAIFCMNDEMAAGAIQALSKHAYKIPQDFSVLGFDNSVVATLLDPPLQTVGVPTEHMAEASIEALSKQISQSSKYISSSLILTEMIHRESTAKPKC